MPVDCGRSNHMKTHSWPIQCTQLSALSSSLRLFHSRPNCMMKVVELVMMRAGCDVCCTSDSDKERMDRVSLELSSD